MSWAIVRTCARCRTRAELPINDVTDVAVVSHVLRLHFMLTGGDLGCPECCPDAAQAIGVDLDVWRAAVRRALGHPVS